MQGKVLEVMDLNSRESNVSGVSQGEVGRNSDVNYLVPSEAHLLLDTRWYPKKQGARLAFLEGSPSVFALISLCTSRHF